MVIRLPLLGEDKKLEGTMVLRKEDFRSAYEVPNDGHTVIHFYDSIHDSIVSGITSLSAWEITEALYSETPKFIKVPLKDKLREDRIKPSDEPSLETYSYYDPEGMSEQDNKHYLLMLFGKALSPMEITTEEDYKLMARIIVALKGNFNAYAEFPCAQQNQIDNVLHDINNVMRGK